MRITIVGAGAMGRPIATRALAGGHEAQPHGLGLGSTFELLGGGD